MKNALIVCITLIVLAAGNWTAATALQLSFLDVSIPFAGLAFAVIYFFKSKGKPASEWNKNAQYQKVLCFHRVHSIFSVGCGFHFLYV